MSETSTRRRFIYDEGLEDLGGVAEWVDAVDLKSKKGKSQKQVQKPKTDSR